MIRAAIVLVALAGPAFAHSFYDPACCSERDCAPIKTHHVQATPDGWVVTLDVGDHPLIRDHQTALFRYTDADNQNNFGNPREARFAPDGQFHACIVSGRIICLYVPEMDT